MSEWQGSLEDGDRPPDVSPADEPPSTVAARDGAWTADHDPVTRDMTPAVGTHGGPASWRPADAEAHVALARPRFGDARWSYLYGARDTEYAAARPSPGQVQDANRRMREAPVPEVNGPFIKPPVWTWEVPLYFWVGGIASGSAFVAAACDAAGDRRSAATARKVALGTVALCPPLLIADLGRPGRFLNMMRIFKPRSPMNMGAWCLVAFSATAAGAVGADVLRRPRAARTLGALTSVIGGYLGSYTGVLLATTAVPVWARSRHVLGPIFICTAGASGAAAVRVALIARGLPHRHPTQSALSNVETAAILSELTLSRIGHRQAGAAAGAMRAGRAGLLFRVAEAAVLAGVATRLIETRATPRVHYLASALYLAGALSFRYAWMEAGKTSAADHGSVAAVARGKRSPLSEADVEVRRSPHLPSRARRPLPLGPARTVWSETVRRVSLVAERMLRGD